MKFKKPLSLLLIGSQLSMAMAIASPSVSGASSANSPEVTMLGKVLVLQGQTLSDQDRQTELSHILKDYTETATEDGVQARLEDALVQLQVFTPAQAEQFVQDSQASGQKALDTATPGQLSAALADQIMQISQLYPQGAQFSACNALVKTGWTAVGLGFAGLLAFILVTAPHKCPPGAQATPENPGYYISGSAVCTAPPVTAHPEIGLGVAVGSGVAIIVGFLLLARTGGSCSN